MVGDGKRYNSIMTMMIDDRNEDVDEKIGEDDGDDKDDNERIARVVGDGNENCSIAIMMVVMIILRKR